MKYWCPRRNKERTLVIPHLSHLTLGRGNLLCASGYLVWNLLHHHFALYHSVTMSSAGADRSDSRRSQVRRFRFHTWKVWKVWESPGLKRMCIDYGCRLGCIQTWNAYGMVILAWDFRGGYTRTGYDAAVALQNPLLEQKRQYQAQSRLCYYTDPLIQWQGKERPTVKINSNQLCHLKNDAFPFEFNI